MLLLEPSPNGTICECFETNTIPNTSITDQTQQREQLQKDNHETREKQHWESLNKLWCNRKNHVAEKPQNVVIFWTVFKNWQQICPFFNFQYLQNQHIFVCCQPIKMVLPQNVLKRGVAKKLFWHEHWRTPLRNTRFSTSNAEFEQKQLGAEIKPMGAEVITTAIKNWNV